MTTAASSSYVPGMGLIPTSSNSSSKRGSNSSRSRRHCPPARSSFSSADGSNGCWELEDHSSSSECEATAADFFVATPLRRSSSSSSSGDAAAGGGAIIPGIGSLPKSTPRSNSFGPSTASLRAAAARHVSRGGVHARGGRPRMTASRSLGSCGRSLLERPTMEPVSEETGGVLRGSQRNRS